MKLIRISILTSTLFLLCVNAFGKDDTDISQKDFSKPYTGLKSDLIMDIKPKSCDFQVWSGQKNYLKFGDSADSQQGQVTKK